MSFCALRFSRFSRPISNYSRSMPIFFGTARFYRSAASTMKYRRRNISMHISYCVCFGGNRKPRGRSKNYLTSKLSLRDARVTVEGRIMAISRFGRREKVLCFTV